MSAAEQRKTREKRWEVAGVGGQGAGEMGWDRCAECRRGVAGVVLPAAGVRRVLAPLG